MYNLRKVTRFRQLIQLHDYYSIKWPVKAGQYILFLRALRGFAYPIRKGSGKRKISLILKMKFRYLPQKFDMDDIFSLSH